MNGVRDLSDSAEAAKRRAMETDPSFISLEQILEADDALVQKWFPTAGKRLQVVMADIAAAMDMDDAVSAA